jgi:luciferase family oxidoreductase group 1
MAPISILDLSPIAIGSNAGQALRNSLDLAQHAERLGYKRLWLAEHHNMPGIASAATAVALAHVASGTSTIRLGSGGIMLPNHAPLMVAEAFGTLAALHPGRIDLGVGRAPGTDQVTSNALRRNLNADVNAFPRDVVELMGYFRKVEPEQRVQAVPGGGLEVPVWILGSSLFGAQLAAMLGLPFAFASHFAAADMEGAIEIYRSRFTPSEHLDKSYVMLGVNVVAADTDAEARFLQSSRLQAFVNLRTGRAGQLPPPIENYEETLDPIGKSVLQHMQFCSVVGSAQTVRTEMEAFIRRTGADEIIATNMIFDHNKSLHSYEILAEQMIAPAAQQLSHTNVS